MEVPKYPLVLKTGADLSTIIPRVLSPFFTAPPKRPLSSFASMLGLLIGRASGSPITSLQTDRSFLYYQLLNTKARGRRNVGNDEPFIEQRVGNGSG